MFKDGQIAPCVMCGKAAVARSISFGGKQQVLPVCDDCLDPREQKKQMVMAVIGAIDPLTPADVATALYHSRHRELLDPAIVNRIEQLTGGAAETEPGLTLIDGGALENAEAKEKMAPPPPVVHCLRYGITECGLMPKQFRDGDKWSTDASEVTCDTCLRGLVRRRTGFKQVAIVEEQGGEAAVCTHVGGVIVIYNVRRMQAHARCQLCEAEAWIAVRSANEAGMLSTEAVCIALDQAIAAKDEEE